MASKVDKEVMPAPSVENKVILFVLLYSQIVKLAIH